MNTSEESSSRDWKTFALKFCLVLAALGFLCGGGWAIPMGLAAFLPEMQSNFAITFCYLPHGLFMLLFATVRKRPLFGIAVFAYGFLLLLDLAGCVRELKGISNIQ